MKVFTYGNTLNNSYYLTKFLRDKGIDAEMFLDNSSKYGQDYPWWEDTHLTPDTLPDWIHYYPFKPNFLFPNKEFKKMIVEFSKCDVALVSGWGPIVASSAKVPFFFFSHGADIYVTFLIEKIKKAIRDVFHFQKPSGIKSALLLGGKQRKAIHNADRIGILMGHQINNYVKKMGLLNKMVLIRLAWDIEKYKPQNSPEMEEKYNKFELVYFMSTRHSWKSVWDDLKGNDKFIRAFARFVKVKKPNVKLVCVRKGQDVSASIKLITSLEIENYVEWIDEINKDGIRAYNSLSNVIIVDQFWHDEWIKKFKEDIHYPRVGFGATGIEALCASKPLISLFFDEDFYDGNHPPMLSAFTEEEIYQRLVESLEMGEKGRNELGKRGYEFVKKYHGWENTVNLYIETLKEILDERAGKNNRSTSDAERTTQVHT